MEVVNDAKKKRKRDESKHSTSLDKPDDEEKGTRERMRRYVAHAMVILPAASASNDSFKPISLEELSSSFSEEALREANVLPIPYSSLVEPLPAETSDKLVRTWQRDGVLVTPEPILTSSQRKTVKEAIVRSINSSLLKDLDPSLHVSFEDPDSLLLLTDSHCRTSKGIDQPDKIFFKGGNRRKPYLSKNTGMWNFYFIPEVMTIVQSHPDIHRVHALLMESPHIKRDCSLMITLVLAIGSNRSVLCSGQRVLSPGERLWSLSLGARSCPTTIASQV